MADPDYVAVPSEGLIDPRYLRARALGIHPGRDMGEAEPGTPPGAFDMPAAAVGQESGTSHLAIVDANGNAVSMTTSVERGFGARIMAGGFVLNSQLTDFAFQPERDGEPVANRVEGGKRPRSSMAPTMVFGADGDLFAALGSPGGPRIIGFVAQTLVGLIDWDLTMQNAIDAVVHMAAYSLVGESVQEPRKYYQNNVVASLSLLDAMINTGQYRNSVSTTPRMLSSVSSRTPFRSVRPWARSATP